MKMSSFRISGILMVAFLLFSCGSSPAGKKTRQSSTPKSQLTGRVVNEVQMEGIPGIEVHLRVETKTVQTVVTDQDGVFSFRDIPEGVLKIDVSDPTGQWETPVPTAVKNDFRERASFTMEDILVGEPSTRFSGRVVYRKGEIEEPIERAVVGLIGTSDDARTNANGEFVLRSREMLEGITSYVLTIFAGEDFKPEVVPLPPGFRLRHLNEIGTVELVPIAGKVDPVTRIKPGYAPSWRGSGGSTTD